MYNSHYNMYWNRIHIKVSSIEPAKVKGNFPCIIFINLCVMCSFNLPKQQVEIPMEMNSVFMLDLSKNIYAGVGGVRSEGIFKLLSSFKSQPNSEFHFWQIHFPSSVPFLYAHICLRSRKKLESGIANCSISGNFIFKLFLIKPSQTYHKISNFWKWVTQNLAQFGDMEYKL